MRNGAGVLALTAFALVSVSPAAAKRLPQRQLPNPSAVVAAELAFNQLAQTKGQWTAFRQTAAKDAVMFVPQQVLARDWLKGRKDPPASVKWQPQKIFMSCDGIVGVSTGAWQRPDGTSGYFTTVWERDGEGRWFWVLDHGDTLATHRPEEEMIAGKVATCPRGMRPQTPPPATDTKAVIPPRNTGQSPDGSLRWTTEVRPDRSRRLTVTLAGVQGPETVLIDDVGAPAS
jgi:hypothetical protein